MSIMDEAQKREVLVREARLLGIEPWQLEAQRAVGTDVIRDLVKDNRGGPAQRSSIIPQSRQEREAPRPNTNGWIEPRPLAPQPGAALIDRIVDAQDKIDRAELERKLRDVSANKDR